MDVNVINWKLNELMARKRIRNKDLAQALGITENSVYRLRKTDQMPRLTPERLNGICTFLQCQPGELLDWSPDNEPQITVEAETFIQESAKGKQKVKRANQKPQPYSFLEIVSGLPESA